MKKDTAPRNVRDVHKAMRTVEQDGDNRKPWPPDWRATQPIDFRNNYRSQAARYEDEIAASLAAYEAGA